MLSPADTSKICPRLTHITFAVKNLDESIEFYIGWLGLEVHLDRRPKGRTVWMTTKEQNGSSPPEFVFVLEEGEVSKINHFGFQVESLTELDRIALEASKADILMEGPVHIGGVVGSYVFVRDPSGHIWEYTHGQPLRGL